MGYKILNFLYVAFLKEWTATYGFFGVLIGLIAFFEKNLSIGTKVWIVIIVILVLFIIKILRQFFNYFKDFRKPIKFIRKVEGDGAYEGNELIILENDNLLRDGNIMTLYCTSSGARQPVCLIELIDTTKDSNIVARIIASQNSDINKFFNELSRKEKLFATPLVNVKDSKFLKTSQ